MLWRHSTFDTIGSSLSFSFDVTQARRLEVNIEPPGGWPKVDREFYVMQGDIYLKGDPAESGVHEAAVDKMEQETPDFVVFNGSTGSLAKERALKAKVGETVRIFFGNAGPNLVSSFHVIGEIFDKVHPEGAAETVSNVQSTLVPAGGATMAQFKTQVPGTYILVDHSLGRLQKGAAGFLEVEGPPNPQIFQSVKSGSSASGGH
jgi:nitrite reductase (NO-forming)